MEHKEVIEISDGGRGNEEKERNNRRGGEDKRH